MSARNAQLQEGLKLQFDQASGKAQEGLVVQAKEALDNYFDAINEMAKFKLAGQTALAEASLAANVFVYERELREILTTLRIEKNREKDRAIDSLNRNLSNTVTTVSAVTLLAIIILAALGALLYRRITGPISRMQAMMSEIASNQNFTHRLPVERHDEIGRSIIAFNTMIAKIEESSVLLKQKTTDLQTMLQNMPQGILTITEDHKIHPEYSAYLETLFETQDIAGRDLMDLVFSNTNLGSDILAQTEAVVGACLGEDVMNFRFNEHLMISEIEKTMPDGCVKILELNWSPITDDTDTTVRLLLCVRDVTELRMLAAEANEKKHELEIIGEILAVSHEKFYEFIENTTKLLEENDHLIHAHPQQNADAIAHLFRNMHTVKGNARTYGFKHLTNIVHDAEQIYDELRKHYPNIVWDQTMLLEELTGVRAEVERYAKINEVSLGRKGPGRRGNIERYLLVDKRQIQEALHRLETVNTSNLYELLAVHNTVHKVLRLLGTEKIDETLAGVFESLPALAMELGKVPPIVEIVDNGYVVRNQISGIVKNVFMHLIRNSMDHGLELPEERLAHGKPAAGTILLEMERVKGMVQIKISDDGRGLALAHIRQAAIEKELIAANDPLSDEEIANQIFRAGFSTAQKLTEVSGRGVGMDAVRNFIKRENGKVEIRFIDQARGAEFRQFETVVCLPANFFVHIEHQDEPPSDFPEDSREAVVAVTSAKLRAVA
ncbi:Histidine kinase [Gammaproteobacteria bacterium]